MADPGPAGALVAEAQHIPEQDKHGHRHGAHVGGCLLYTSRLGIPVETIALLLVRPVSGSAALGVGAELIQTYGPDSLIGRTAAVMLGSTETTFYTIAVYFGAAGIVKTRYAVPAALCADLAGFMAAAWACLLYTSRCV